MMSRREFITLLGGAAAAEKKRQEVFAAIATTQSGALLVRADPSRGRCRSSGQFESWLRNDTPDYVPDWGALRRDALTRARLCRAGPGGNHDRGCRHDEILVQPIRVLLNFAHHHPHKLFVGHAIGRARSLVARPLAQSCDQRVEALGRRRAAAFGSKDVRASRVLLALQAAQCADLSRRCSINRARAFLRWSVCSSLIIASHGPSLTE